LIIFFNIKRGKIEIMIKKVEVASVTRLTSVSIILIAGMLLSGFYAPAGWDWFLVIILMIGFVFSLGKSITGSFFGIFVSEVNRMSLSRFQLVLWTLIVLSAFLTIALKRVAAGVTDPLAIALPEQLWLLLGISTTALVGTPLILKNKEKKEPAAKFIKKAEDRAVKSEQITSEVFKDNVKIYGIRAVNEDKKEAKFTDMFTGEELINSHIIDVAKVQMFFFTLLIALSYMILLLKLIRTADPAVIDSFPALSDGIVALLGISSGGYLTSKAIDQTPTA